MVKKVPDEIIKSLYEIIITLFILAFLASYILIDIRYSDRIETYKARDDTKNERIELIKEKAGAKTLEDVIKTLDELLAKADVRNELGLYQNGVLVAYVMNPNMEMERKIITFSTVTTTHRELDMAHNFEFRDRVIMCRGSSTGFIQFGSEKKVDYPNLECQIIGKR